MYTCIHRYTRSYALAIVSLGSLGDTQDIPLGSKVWSPTMKSLDPKPKVLNRCERLFIIIKGFQVFEHLAAGQKIRLGP